jgi:hypothetical protein
MGKMQAVMYAKFLFGCLMGRVHLGNIEVLDE